MRWDPGMLRRLQLAPCYAGTVSSLGRWAEACDISGFLMVGPAALPSAPPTLILWAVRESPPLAKMVQGEVPTLSVQTLKR